MTTVNWTTDGSTYLIESREHLLQLMNQGSLYTDTGSPISYTSNLSFRQTVDIDLVDVQDLIEPIFGTTAVTSANGSYDGGGYTISNWSYSKTNKDHIGLFGYLYDGKIINVNLKGVWNLDVASNISSGFLLGEGGEDSDIQNCHAIFDDGTTMLPVKTSGHRTAGMIGSMPSGTRIYGVSIAGYLNFTTEGWYIGGVVGYVNDMATVSYIRNTARVPNIHGVYVGGVVAYVRDSSANTLINTMIGNITSSSSYAGGVIAYVQTSSSGTSSKTIQRCVNSMTGNITGSSSGGVVGLVNINSTVTLSYSFNYMTGDISTSGILGKLILQTSGTPRLSLGSCIVAMNGNTAYAVTNPSAVFYRTPTVTVDTSFGMTFTRPNDFVPGSNLVFFHESFPDLPYFALDYHPWDFVFGNLSGKPAYSEYTHLSIHTSEVSSPFRTTFEESTVPYAAFSNLGDTEMFISENLVVVDSQATRIFDDNGVQVFPPPPMMLSPRSINILVDITEVPGALGYRVTKVSGSREVAASSKSGNPFQVNVKSLEPETQYTLNLYVDSGAGYVLTSTQSATTLPDNNDNYVVSDFLEEGIFRIEDFSTDTREKIAAQMNTLFATGDRVKISTKRKPDILARFVNTGGVVSTAEEESILVPFDEASGASQNITLSLSDNVTTVAVNYDDTQNTIAVGLEVYATGDSFVVDGKKCTVLDYE